MAISKSLQTVLITAAVVVFMAVLCNKSGDNSSSDPDAAYFSGWDGSNPELVDAVKASMNGPESFKHISIGTLNNPNGTIKIQIKFTGNNAFGGTVQNTVTADFDKNSRTIDNLKKTE